jgi:hypothetical protein
VGHGMVTSPAGENTRANPWNVMQGIAFQCQAQTWSAFVQNMYPYVSKCGTVVGVWLGSLGYLGGAQENPVWVPLPQSRGFNPNRLFVVLAHCTNDPGRRGRLITNLMSQIRSTAEMLHSPFVPFRIQLTYSTASPSDDQAAWAIETSCVAGRVFAGMQRTVAQEVLAHATVFDIGLANTVFPVLTVVGA